MDILLAVLVILAAEIGVVFLVCGFVVRKTSGLRKELEELRAANERNTRNVGELWAALVRQDRRIVSLEARPSRPQPIDRALDRFCKDLRAIKGDET